MWIVLSIKHTLKLEVLGGSQELPLNWSDGMVGAIPVFKYKKDAKRYAGKETDIAEIAVVKED